MTMSSRKDFKLDIDEIVHLRAEQIASKEGVSELKQLVADGGHERDKLRKYNAEYRERLIDLEAATKPRPMSEAPPMNGKAFWGVDARGRKFRLRSTGKGWVDAYAEWNPARMELVGWLPASEEGEGLRIDCTHMPRVWVGSEETGHTWVWRQMPGALSEAAWVDCSWVEKGQVFMPPGQPKPTVNPADLGTLTTCSKVDWLPTICSSEYCSVSPDPHVRRGSCPGGQLKV